MSFCTRLVIYLVLYGLYLWLSSHMIPRHYIEQYFSAGVDAAGKWCAVLGLVVVFLSAIQGALFPYDLPDYIHACGPVTYWSGSLLVIFARRANPFFLPIVIKPPRLIKNGPYRLRHPGYIGFGLQMLGTLLILGQPIGLLPAIPYLGLLVYRTVQENRLLYGS